ncbi:secondary thiamine-phosphate synthase enzyme YjbQ [Poriferisphaera sp. WC338]|uniref:secondary thiamine-phosphate synthase enzyme YjbQ n=1 Tax=Poriferisphaera sp. WC338 TaxID=3425129 RepID=UPI003D814FC0
MFKHTLTIPTSQRSEMIEITVEVQKLIDQSDIQDGYVIVYIPHTTAGVTINENADPDVVHDMLKQLDLMVPWTQPFYRHAEGNSASHVKATMTGSSVTVMIENGHMILGTWQGIYFCEFDGSRSRKAIVSIIEA